MSGSFLYWWSFPSPIGLPVTHGDSPCLPLQVILQARDTPSLQPEGLELVWLRQRRGSEVAGQRPTGQDGTLLAADLEQANESLSASVFLPQNGGVCPSAPQGCGQE